MTLYGKPVKTFALYAKSMAEFGANSTPRMDWSAPNQGEEFKLFQQRCELFFSVKDIRKEKQVDHILLMSGVEGLKKIQFVDTDRR